MRRFRVLTDTCGSTKKIYNKNDIVLESDFERGKADDLVRRKFLQEIKSSGKKIEQSSVPVTHDISFKKPEEIKKPEEDIWEMSEDDPDYKKPITSSNGDVDVAEMIQDLKNAKIKFDPDSSKQEIKKLWLTIV